MELETLAVHAGHAVDPATGAVTPPIYLSTTFERDANGEFSRGHVYTRDNNPNRQWLERTLALLEGGCDAAAFASGSAATNALLQALGPGAQLILPLDAYAGTPRLAALFAAWGLLVSRIDFNTPGALAAALETPASQRLVWLETPSNPLLRISDIAAVTAEAHAAGALVACDNTWATPLGQRPLELGADLVMHSTTKYLGGHSDVLGGALIAREDGPLWQRIREVQLLAGAVPAPFDCWLVQRGIQTLPYRLRAQSTSALELAQWLSAQPQISAVFYPGLPTHAGHAIAARQMRLWGGMLSIRVHGGAEAAMAVAAQVQLWTRATSLGGPESLVEHRASVEGPDTLTPPDLLRLSVGLEHPRDLIADLEQALRAAPHP